MAVQTYSIRIKVERISNGFTVNVNSSDQDGMDKYYPQMSDMIADLKTHFENKLGTLEQEYQIYLSNLLKPENLQLNTSEAGDTYNLSWDLANQDLLPKDFIIEYRINGIEWLQDLIILDKQNWEDPRRNKESKVQLPSSLSTGDVVEFRVKGTHDGFPDSQYCEAVTHTVA